ncbi:thermonuclease family protein [Mycoplasma sp. 2261]
MKKNIKRFLLSSLIAPSLPIASYMLVQCTIEKNNDTQKLLRKITEYKNTISKNVIDLKLCNEIADITNEDSKSYSRKKDQTFLKQLIIILEDIKKFPINNQALPINIDKLANKLKVINEIWISIFNKHSLLNKKEHSQITTTFLKIRSLLSFKKVIDTEVFDSIIKKFIILAKKIRKTYTKKLSQWSEQEISLLKFLFKDFQINDNKINNGDLDEIFNNDSKIDSNENSQDKKDISAENSKDKEIYLTSKSIYVNNKEYLLSNDLRENNATEVSAFKINDGDTAELKNIKNNKTFRFRFSGIDTPETWKKVGQKFEPTVGLQFKYGKIAKNFTTRNLLEAKKIWVIPQTTISDQNKDENKKFFDAYGRIVAIILVYKNDGSIICINKELIKNGFSKVSYISLDKRSKYYTKNENFYFWLKNNEKEARNQKLGIWSDNIKEIYPPKRIK